MRVSENVQSGYDDFQTFVHDEMNSRLPKTIFQNGINKRKKSLSKPYWNNKLTEQWNLVCFTYNVYQQNFKAVKRYDF